MTKTKEGKWPIDRPCSACSAGDYKMEYHLHDWPPREGWTPEPETPSPTPQSTHPQGFSGPISGPGTVDPRRPQFDEIERLRAELAEAREALEAAESWLTYAPEDVLQQIIDAIAKTGDKTK